MRVRGAPCSRSEQRHRRARAKLTSRYLHRPAGGSFLRIGRSRLIVAGHYQAEILENLDSTFSRILFGDATLQPFAVPPGAPIGTGPAAGCRTSIVREMLRRGIDIQVRVL